MASGLNERRTSAAARRIYSLQRCEVNGLDVHPIYADAGNAVASGPRDQVWACRLQLDGHRLRVTVGLNAENAGHAVYGGEVHCFVNLALLRTAISEGYPHHCILTPADCTPTHTY